MLRGRLGKWMLALTEFDLQYVPARAVKGQVIADFLVDNLKDLNDQGANVVDVEINYWKLYFDGSKHKDGAGIGILIISPEGIPLEFLFELKYPCSNNVAEYEALILGLEILIDKGTLEVQILGDSQLVLKQLSKEYKCNNETLQKYLVTSWGLLTSFQMVSLLAQIASRYRVSPETLKKLYGIHQILVPANEREILCVDEWEDSDWRKPIAHYLRNPRIDGSLSRCLSRKDQNFSLGKKMRSVLYRKHVYWPSMIKDCIDYAKACQECQKHGSIQQIPAAELHLIIKPWPFREVGQSEIIDFVEEHIIHRFGIPQTLSTDQGTMLTGQRVKNFVASRSINMVTSTPYYAQTNGQTLSQVLWAYRNSPRGLTGTSPYKLVYGHDTVLPLKINLNTLRVSKQNELPVDDYWNAMFDELNELDSERILTLDNVIRQKESVARSYNRRIKEKSFRKGELVLKVILPMEKKSRFLGKWSHSWEGPFQVTGIYSGNAYLIKDIESRKVINLINGKYLKLFYCWKI
ncbi:hypothetical protein AAHE18_U087100 [Arachis hypogaea]